MVTLSSILCNLAFFFPFTGGFLVTVCWFPLYRAYVVTARRSFLPGFIWGVLFFGPHFVWFAHLLCTTTSLSSSACFLWYGATVLYYAGAAGVWFALMAQLKRSLLLFLGGFLLYFHWITCYSLWFFTHVKGYPFLSLFLPLTHYASFLSTLIALQTFLLSPLPERPITSSLQEVTNGPLVTEYHLTVGGKVYKISGMRLPADLCGPSVHAAGKRTPLMLGNFLYHMLTRMNLHDNAHAYEKIYIMAPESTFPYPLEQFPEIVSLLQTCLPAPAVFILGSIHKKNDKSFQSLWCLTSSTSACWYDKRVLIDGTEIALPWPLRSFFDQAPSFASGEGRPHFVLENTECMLQPFICAEAFIEKPFMPGQKACIKCAYVNDAWFLPYMQELMLLLFRFRAAIDPCFLQLYIAHSRTYGEKHVPFF